MSSDLSFILGTRPEIIKLSPVIRACQQRDVPFSLIHTGQHYSDELDSVFFEQLELPAPEYNLSVGSGSQGKQTGEMIVEIESVLEEEQPDVVLVQGDTNSVLAGTIAATKIEGIEVGHVEAGLRSFDREMPEEINRRLADHSADYLFPPTETSRQQLLSEGLPDDWITVTGNTIVDAVMQNAEIAHEQSCVLSELGVEEEFGLLTAHRAENVDNRDRFISLLEGVAKAAREQELPVVYPIHPRAKKRIAEFDIDVPEAIRIMEPQDFLDFLVLEDEATIVFTDSGGVQEETCILQTPCVTLRDNTERPETVEVDANRIVGVEPDDIAEGTREMITVESEWENPFGDGTSAEQILDALEYDRE
ncbi:UDP-N-acetylglucosamine 2-epimerase (non-hydrolyzing) [Halobiforma lacisalsi AJ5]|uniref:UDP-N-acetylglucosamine 2-epimerase n=1 Tax=Natronobacterium lacisalsi AJ5 TaxID=358396 RepID=M0L102_NATLA|nr:UDP-N-acetylglucosamine 2-epimerase (non-hydrolyzing) [Halobiforma lacisalsi]APW98888.1 UDP-N-acetylglucosamine 2-epimerase (non-hydrolyzing) [Halobiforma lacisalsi AJ5]EMA27226.1 UDP-N-acetylglucosamine 2-epimerase [Halobiforma lacisalsi AJ5]